MTILVIFNEYYVLGKLLGRTEEVIMVSLKTQPP